MEVIDEDCITLRGCYVKYLTKSNKPSIPGMRARYLKVALNSELETKKGTDQKAVALEKPEEEVMTSVEALFLYVVF